MEEKRKPIIGITLGDINGIGPQIILKALANERLYKMCQIVVFGSESVIQFYKKTFPVLKTNFQIIDKNADTKYSSKMPNLVECSEKEVPVNMGVSNEFSGSQSLRYINDALFFLQNKRIDALVTAPVNKSFIKTNPEFLGHTDYLGQKASVNNTLMIMASDTLKIALVTHHVALQEVSGKLTIQNIQEKLKLFNHSLMYDFGIQRPKIAVLSLNPHSGENGKLGKEEKDVIQPAIEKALQEKILAQGPFAADGFFSSLKFQHFDGVLAMYHDQGLIPFKYIAGMEGINFTANLPYVRTSPDHGVALELVSEDVADPNSMMHAIYSAIDIHNTREDQKKMRLNPLPKATIKDFKD